MRSDWGLSASAFAKVCCLGPVCSSIPAQQPLRLLCSIAHLITAGLRRIQQHKRVRHALGRYWGHRQPERCPTRKQRVIVPCQCLNASVAACFRQCSLCHTAAAVHWPCIGIAPEAVREAKGRRPLGCFCHCRLAVAGLPELPDPLVHQCTSNVAPAMDAVAAAAGLATLSAAARRSDPGKPHLPRTDRAAPANAALQWSFARRQSYGPLGRRSFERGAGGVATALAEQQQRRLRRYSHHSDASRSPARLRGAAWQHHCRRRAAGEP